MMSFKLVSKIFEFKSAKREFSNYVSRWGWVVGQINFYVLKVKELFLFTVLAKRNVTSTVL